MTDLEINITLIINGLQEEGAPPSRREIGNTISAQVTRALERLIADGLVEVVLPGWGREAVSRFKLADKVPDGMTFVRAGGDT